MPYRMHSEYLRQLFLGTIWQKGAIWWTGDLWHCQTYAFHVCGRYRDDHIAPWRSVYKIHLLTDIVSLSY